MSGTRAGGIKTYRTILRRHGKDFYRQMGLRAAKMYRKQMAEGTATPRGFAVMSPQKRSEAGRKGGLKSRRGPAQHSIDKEPMPPMEEPDHD